MNKGYFYAFLTALCWSTSGLFVKFMNQNAVVIAGMTSLIALLFNRIVMRYPLKLNGFTVSVGICQMMMHLTFVIANQLTTVGNAIVLQYSSIIFVLLYKCMEEKKRPKTYQIGVVITAFIGMSIFFFDSFAFKSIFGNGMAILSGAFFGLQFFLNSHDKADPNTSLTVQYGSSFILMMIYLIIGNCVSFHKYDILIIILSGLLQTALAGVFFAKCIKLIPPFTANIICMSEIILSPLWAAIFLQEMFTPLSFLGALIMIAALLLNSYMEYQTF